MEPKEGWPEVEAAERMHAEGAVHVEGAWKKERNRCLELVQAEIKEGTTRGIPQTSGTMVILYRLAAAIGNG